MGERPFMQLYVSDFIGDTLHLSTEQVGAYLLLLMAMWNAGGSLPDDEAKLARIVRMSARKWRAVAADLMPFFERAGGAVRHKRLTRELQKSEEKSELRSNAGKLGAAAKALKNNDPPPANDSGLLKHSPEARSQIVDKPSAQHSEPRVPAALLDRLFEANGLTDARLERHPGLLNLSLVLGWIGQGYDLDADIIPAIRAKPNPKARSWSYFAGQVADYAANRRGAGIAPAPPAVEQVVAAWPLERWKTVIGHYRQTGDWNRDALGPKPGEKGCKAPPELLQEQAA